MSVEVKGFLFNFCTALYMTDILGGFLHFSCPPLKKINSTPGGEGGRGGGGRGGGGRLPPNFF